MREVQWILTNAYPFQENLPVTHLIANTNLNGEFDKILKHFKGTL